MTTRHPIPKNSHLPVNKRILSVLTIVLSFFLAASSFPAFSDDAEDYYQKGMDRMRNEPEIAVKYLEKAANLGHAKAQYELGNYYLVSARSEIYDTFDWVGGNRVKGTAVQWFKLAADQGLPEALYKLGNCYEFGDGVQKDINEAINWYKRASEKGYSSASMSIAEIYDKDGDQVSYGGFGGFGSGTGYGNVAQTRGSKVEAFKWYKTAAEQGNDFAYKKVAEAYEKGTYGGPVNLTEALNWYKKAARYTRDILFVAKAYEEGTYGPKDLTEALNWYKKAAEQNDSSIDNTLFVAKAYEKGTYGPKDLTEAFNWYKKAADRGYAEGLYGVGRCYMDGLGVGKDEDSALQYFERAADKGSGSAAFKLYLCYYEGTGVEKDIKKANEFFKKAYSRNITDPDMANKCAEKCKFEGTISSVRGNEQDAKKWMNFALDCYKNAAKAGSIESARFLSRIYEEGGQSRNESQNRDNLFVYKNKEEAQKWFVVAAENGDIEALFTLGQQCMKNKDEKGALKWFRKAAERGHAQAKEYVELLED